MIIAADRPCSALPSSNNTALPVIIMAIEPIILKINATRVIFTLPTLSEILPPTTINTPVTNDVKLIEILMIFGLTGYVF